MNRSILFYAISGALMFCLSSGAMAMDGKQMHNLYEHIYNSTLDTLSTVRVADLDIDSRDMKLHLNKGRLAFFKPVNINGTDKYYAAYFVGDGDFTFSPSSEESILRINHKVGEDSVFIKTKSALLAFSDQIYQKIKDELQPCDDKFGKSEVHEAKKSWERLTNREEDYFVFQLMRHLTEPSDEPFLMINPQKWGWSQSFYYCYDPMFVEDIRLFKNEVVGPNFSQQMRTVCAYTCPAGKRRDGCFRFNDPQITPQSYDVLAQLDSSLYMNVDATITYKVNEKPVQLLWFTLLADMQIDKITDGENQPVYFLRYTKESNRSDNLYLSLNRTYRPGEELVLHFQYNGRVVDIDKSTWQDIAVDGGLYNFSGDSWCPQYYEPQKSNLRVEYQYPAMYDKLKLTSIGKETVHEIKDGIMLSTWQSEEPDYYITFKLE